MKNTKIHEFDAEEIYQWNNPDYDHMDLTKVIEWFIDRGWDTKLDEDETLWFVRPEENKHHKKTYGI